MIVLTIYIYDSSTVIANGYTHIKVYRSNYSDGAFLEVSTVDTRPVITTTERYYNFEDTTGISSSWYKTSYYNPITLAESSVSPAAHGTEIDRFMTPTYPADASFSTDDYYAIDRIRYYIGDPKTAQRDYVSPNCTSGYDNVSLDGTSYKLSSGRGWPLKVVKDSVEYVSKDNPLVSDYTYLTFSGTTISTSSGILDVWYEGFRHSDREILKVFTTTPPPPYTSSSTATDEMYLTSASITIIQQELVKLMGETSGSFTLQGEMSYNPEPLLREKRALLESLKNKLDELVNEVTSNNITGVRIE